MSERRRTAPRGASATRAASASATTRRRTEPNAESAAGDASAANVAATWSILWPALAIVIVALVTYANALGHPFVMDDTNSILENQTIHSLGASVRGGPPQSPTAGRPLVNMSFAVNYMLGGVSPWGYHAVNLGVHLACALLVYMLLRQMLTLPRLAEWSAGHDTGIAATAALLWTVHPLNSEVVNYATQRSEELVALAFLLTLYFGVRAIGTSWTTAWATASVMACAAGMSSKESMATAPVIMLLLDSTFVSGGPRAAVRRRPFYYLALFATWIVLALLIIEGPRWRSAGFASGVSPWNYLLNQAPMVARYFRLVIWPTGLVLDYGEPIAQTLRAVWPSALLVVGLLGGTLALWAFAPALAFFATWCFITLAPTSSIVPIATEVGAERRMYLPLVAVLTLIVLVASRVLLRTRTPGMRRGVTVATAAAACALLIGLTISRNSEYSSGLRIWQTTVERYPSGRARYNLGLELKAVGRRADAVHEYELAVATHPEAHYALGFELDEDGRHDRAVEHYRQLIEARPIDANVPRTYIQIGRALFLMGRHEEALTAYRDALARKRGDTDALGGLADTLVALERWTDAVAAYGEYLRINPSVTTARFNMGLALVHLDRDAEARDAFATVVQQEPTNVAARVNLAYALANTGRLGDSVKEFRRAAELETDPAGRATIEGAIAQLLGAH